MHQLTCSRTTGHQDEPAGTYHQTTHMSECNKADTLREITGASSHGLAFEIPNFDLGISPQKPESQSNVENQRPKRLRLVGDSLKSPYIQRAVTFEVTADEKRIQS